METCAGIVTLVGKPNVGKSTLLNGMLGTQVAPVTSKPQTTRRQLRGIYCEDGKQIVFVDTPGLHEPADALDTYMQRQIRDALEDVDVVLWVVDMRHPPTSEDQMVAQQLDALRGGPPMWLVGNKLDTATRPDDALRAYQALLPSVTHALRVSAKNPQDTDRLRSDLLSRMPPGPFLYPTDFGKSDQTPDQWTAEMIRQAAMERLREELPYTVAVKVDVLEERKKAKGTLMYCKAFLYIEREAHKSMVIGERGRMLKAIGQQARRSIESMLGRQVFLDIEVKVYPNWRKDKEALRELDYQ